MQTIYHLGLHKTGSTSLQFFLQANQQRLAQAGILFPPVSPKGLAHFDADAAAASAPDAPRRVPELNDYMGHNALAYQMIAEAVPGTTLPEVHAPMPTAEQALSQIEAQARGKQVLVFCSEDLARASLMVPEVPQHFAARFGTEAVTLIAALRRPDAAIAAWQTQRLRFGIPFEPVHEAAPETWLGTVHFEYRAALEPWLQAFPTASVRLVPYARLRDMGGSVGSFAALSGLDLPPGLTPLPDSNPGLPHALLDIARQGLGALARDEARALLRYLEGVGARVKLPPNEQIDVLGEDARAVLAQSFRHINDWLCQVTGRWPFFDDLDEMRAPRPLSMPSATARVMPALLDDAAEYLEDAKILAFLARVTP